MTRFEDPRAFEPNVAQNEELERAEEARTLREMRYDEYASEPYQEDPSHYPDDPHEIEGERRANELQTKQDEINAAAYKAETTASQERLRTQLAPVAAAQQLRNQTTSREQQNAENYAAFYAPPTNGPRPLQLIKSTTTEQPMQEFTHQPQAAPIPPPPAAESKMSVAQLADRITGMENTAVQRDLKRGNRPPTKRDATQHRILEAYRAELARRDPTGQPSVRPVFSSPQSPAETQQEQAPVFHETQAATPTKPILQANDARNLKLAMLAGLADAAGLPRELVAAVSDLIETHSCIQTIDAAWLVSRANFKPLQVGRP